ncbi:glycosyltransferase [Desulfonema ishimotonii]|uniref:Glycosyltransferase n=1 Tax=Desulfonema ishimotonii TaxID=45657 RepID=A0A401FQH9_9BACT|nr:glycosyltransferase [Desulfonema ishimotonii]GBC59249.1 glycosyltransferase [Desulfonema ishimotonii]
MGHVEAEGAALKVMQLALSLEVGGAERIVATIVRKSRPGAFFYQACCLDAKGTYARALEADGHDILMVRRKPGVDWSVPFKLARLVCREKIRVIHAHGETPWFYGVLASLLLMGRVKCLTTVHGWDRVTPKKKKLWTVLSLFSHKVVVVSQRMRDELVAQDFIPRRKIATIINGVDIEEIDASPRQRRSDWGLGSGVRVMGTVSRLSPLKKIDHLVLALDLMVKAGHNVKLMIVGDGPERPFLGNRVAELGLEARVIFAGNRKDAYSFFPLFDVFVLPSLSEGISMTILEAMTQGVPVVAADIKGNREIITHNNNGIFYTPGDVAALAQSLGNLFEHPGYGIKIASRARKRVESDFSFERMLVEYERLYLSGSGSEKQNLSD